MSIPILTMKKSTLILLACSIFTAMLAAACGKSADKTDTVAADAAEAPVVSAEGKTVIPPREVTAIINAVADNNRSAFASAVSYPLARPYPLRDVDDSAKMVIYYPVLVDDSLRSVLKAAKAEEWNGNGWRGWTLADGQYLWIDEKLYAVNYVSRAEQAMLHTLIAEEINSLEPELRKGWHPVFCLHGVDSGTIFRVDTRSIADTTENEGPYRLAVYDKGCNLHGRPSMSMRGQMDVDGSAGVRTYVFSGRDGSRAYYVYDRMSEDDPQEIIIITARGDSVTHRVERAYWRDYLSGAGQASKVDIPGHRH